MQYAGENDYQTGIPLLGSEHAQTTWELFVPSRFQSMGYREISKEDQACYEGEIWFFWRFAIEGLFACQASLSKEQYCSSNYLQIAFCVLQVTTNRKKKKGFARAFTIDNLYYLDQYVRCIKSIFIYKCVSEETPLYACVAIFPFPYGRYNGLLFRCGIRPAVHNSVGHQALDVFSIHRHCIRPTARIAIRHGLFRHENNEKKVLGSFCDSGDYTDHGGNKRLAFSTLSGI